MNAIATIDDMGGALSIEHIKRQVQTVQQVMRDVMIEGEHYGKIPGCGDKAALMKSGAEKLCFTFQLVPTFEVITNDLPGGHREYFVKCRLSNRSGQLIAEGVGTCSTMEPKYRYRKAERTCPRCGKPAIMKSKNQPEFYCWAKKDGCGATFALDDKTIVGQEVGRVENTDPAEFFNTCLKIGKKRSHVDATITATAASDIFAQDIDENLEKEDAAKAQAQQAAPAPAEAPRPTPAAAPAPAKAASTGTKTSVAASGPAGSATPQTAPMTPRTSPTASPEHPHGIGKAECDAAAYELRNELDPMGLAPIAMMVWWGDMAGMASRHATLLQARADVAHYRKAVGDDIATSMLEDLAKEYGYPGAAKSQSAENKARCAEFVHALRMGAMGEVAS